MPSKPSSDDWLASIDLDAVKPAKGQKNKRTKGKKPRKRVVVSDTAAPARRVFWPQGHGPDRQRQVREVAGKFIPADDVCSILASYDEAVEILSLIAASDHPNKPRLSHVLRHALSLIEFQRAAEHHQAAEAQATRDLTTLVNKAVDQITLED